MDSIQAILNSPLPIAVLAVICVASLAGYWFFVIPMLEEIKTLRTRNTELESTMIIEIKNQTVAFEAALADLNRKVSERRNLNELAVLIGELKTTIERQTADLSTATNDIIKGVRSAISAIAKVIAEKAEASARDDDELRRDLERLSRLVEQLSRQVSDVSERQSQVTGILTGMSITRSSNKSL